MRILKLLLKSILTLALMFVLSQASFAQDKPNILIIWGDDVGYWNLSHINRGMMGYMTPNIDRIAAEGLSFTDYYAQQSCTAGRAAFITGQIPVRTGLTKVGMPGAPQGLYAEDPTIAELLKPLGYVTGQFGKNHLGDRDEHLPTVHGFDEFFGNLYHLNIEEEPELPDYPKGKIGELIRPRGVIKSYADGKIEDTGPLTKKRMETVDEEFLAATKDFISRAQKKEKPFFVWFCATRMHVFTHLKPESEGKTGLGIYPDGMVEHDGHVGELLDYLDELGIAENTIVMYSSDNGAEVFTWPDGGTTPFKGEKGTCWEGGFRVPAVVRWPGHIPAGKIVNGIVSHEDWLPTLLAAVRYNDKKVHFMIQEAHGFDVWKNPYTPLGWPSLVNLRADPFERAMHESLGWGLWAIQRMYALSGAAVVTTEFLKSFLEFPPRQEPGSFSVDKIIKKLEAARSGNK